MKYLNHSEEIEVLLTFFAILAFLLAMKHDNYGTNHYQHHNNRDHNQPHRLSWADQQVKAPLRSYVFFGKYDQLRVGDDGSINLFSAEPIDASRCPEVLEVTVSFANSCIPVGGLQAHIAALICLAACKNMFLTVC